MARSQQKSLLLGLFSRWLFRHLLGGFLGSCLLDHFLGWFLSGLFGGRSSWLLHGLLGSGFLGGWLGGNLLDLPALTILERTIEMDDATLQRCNSSFAKLARVQNLRKP